MDVFTCFLSMCFGIVFFSVMGLIFFEADRKVLYAKSPKEKILWRICSLVAAIFVVVGLLIMFESGIYGASFAPKSFPRYIEYWL